jgi:HK97 gp10 family phage protein
MADFDVKLTGFKELEQKLLSLESGEQADAIERRALRAVGAVIKPALEAATPVRGNVYGPLPKGALKTSVRARTRLGKNGEPSVEIVDFGNLSFIAHVVDVGHVNANAKKGRKHTPAHPFIRSVEDATHEAAADAYLETLEAGIVEVLEK